MEKVLSRKRRHCFIIVMLRLFEAAIFTLWRVYSVHSYYLIFMNRMEFYQNQNIYLKIFKLNLYIDLVNLACMDSQKLHPFDGKRSVTFKSHLWKVK